MASKKQRIKYLQINANKGSFVYKLIGPKQEQDFSEVSLLKSLFSHEKARILYTLKISPQNSIYALAKFLKRDFKSVRDDIKVLEKFGLIEFQSTKTGKRSALKPVLTTDELNIILSI